MKTIIRYPMCPVGDTLQEGNLKSFELYRITSDDDFAENIYIHSNVNNGFGIVAGINSDVHMMDITPGK